MTVLNLGTGCLTYCGRCGNDGSSGVGSLSVWSAYSHSTKKQHKTSIDYPFCRSHISVFLSSCIGRVISACAAGHRHVGFSGCYNHYQRKTTSAATSEIRWSNQRKL